MLLSTNTSKAINAIKDKDEETLNKVLKETEALRQEVDKLRAAVYKDALTNVNNRKWLHDNILQENSDLFKKAGTMAIVDLNYFKIVNDTYGHIVGDKVLIFVANQLKKTKYDVVRYGGDEFLIIFDEKISLNKAIAKLDGIREDILGKKIKTKDSSFKVSFSFGVCEFNLDNNLTEIIEQADKNMYEDKINIKKR